MARIERSVGRTENASTTGLRRSLDTTEVSARVNLIVVGGLPPCSLGNRPFSVGIRLNDKDKGAQRPLSCVGCRVTLG